jgi:hypothetical protein
MARRSVCGRDPMLEIEAVIRPFSAIGVRMFKKLLPHKAVS